MKKSFRIIIGSIFVSLTSCGLLLAQPDSSPQMHAHFINVGQADSTLLEFPCGAVLIDAGAQDTAYQDKLIQYLNTFFQGRPELTNTLEAVFITHPHIDHTFALKRVVQDFNVKRFIENGQTRGSGVANINWVRSEAPQRHITLRTILNSEVMKAGNKKGLTDDTIDPLHCDKCDPKIVIYSGQWDNHPNWPQSERDSNNNEHSLVIRIDFGQSSFLFPGDLETYAIQSLLDFYGGTPGSNGTNALNVFDVDVYHVDHHGSSNGTTTAWVQALTPSFAVISCGQWNYGQGTANPFTTWAYGHPRKVTLDLLSSVITATRTDPVWIQAATGARKFSQTVVRKNIYATAWDGNIEIGASLQHVFTVSRNN